MKTVYFFRFTEPLPEEGWEKLFCSLPEKERKRILRFRRWQDRHARLFGALLLRKGLAESAVKEQAIGMIMFNPHGRPCIDAPVDFNISHSGEYVLCAVTDHGHVGIDIERIRPIDIQGFRKYMTDDQWDDIQTSADPLIRFFDYWTMKESVLKADGKGLSSHLRNVWGRAPEIVFDGRIWHVEKIGIDERYCCHLASDREDAAVTIREISCGENGFI